jgi:hypothetical protein
VLWENAVRVSSEKQTLILAGEAVPQRPLPRPLTIVATPADVTLLLSQGDGMSSSAEPALLQPAAAFAFHRNVSNGAAGAYARTQALARGNSRTAIIDTYA